MKSSVYVSSERIEVIGYTITGGIAAVKGYITAPLAEGTMINGKIIDSTHLTEALASLRAKSPALFKEPSLIVDGSSILTLRASAPKLNARQLERFVRDGFSDTADNPEDLACAYQTLRSLPGGGKSLFAVAADQAQVESYISSFRNAGIQLQSIRVGPQALMRYIANRPDFLMHTFVLNVIDGVMMLSMIVDNGVNVFMSRTRLYSENYEQLIQRVLENLSGLIQFNRSEKFNEITHSYYVGLNPEDLQFMREISPYPDITLDIPDLYQGVKGGETLSPTAHFAFLNTLLGKDSIDLIRSLKVLRQRKRRQRPKKLWIPALVSIVLLVASISGLLLYRAAQDTLDLAEIQLYLNDPARISELNELQTVMDETADINRVLTEFQDKELRDSANAMMTNRVLDVITGTLPELVSITQLSFDDSQNTVSISGQSSTDTGTPQYVKALKQHAMIRDVTYTGYTSVGDEYNFSLSIRLNPDGGTQP